MPHDSISEIHPPREIGRKSVGKISYSDHDCTDTSYQYTEDDSWKKEDTSWHRDGMEIFIHFSGNDPTEESSGDGLREEDASWRIPPGDHRSIECGDDDPSEHRSCDDEEIIFDLLTPTREWIRELRRRKNLPIEKPCYEERGHISCEIVEDLYIPVREIK
jgi:hypothetical protein